MSSTVKFTLARPLDHEQTFVANGDQSPNTLVSWIQADPCQRGIVRQAETGALTPSRSKAQTDARGVPPRATPRAVWFFPNSATSSPPAVFVPRSPDIFRNLLSAGKIKRVRRSFPILVVRLRASGQPTGVRTSGFAGFLLGLACWGADWGSMRRDTVRFLRSASNQGNNAVEP
jgi:hypothetical protein